MTFDDDEGLAKQSFGNLEGMYVNSFVVNPVLFINVVGDHSNVVTLHTNTQTNKHTHTHTQTNAPRSFEGATAGCLPESLRDPFTDMHETLAPNALKLSTIYL